VGEVTRPVLRVAMGVAGKPPPSLMAPAVSHGRNATGELTEPACVP
jgi:hypothetical protein